MATTRDYLAFVMEQLPAEAASRAMMGEYVLYYRGRVFGGLYDNRLLVKPIPAALALLPQARQELPYDGAKPMLLVENMEDRDFLAQLLEAMYFQLPEPKKKKSNA